MPLERTKLGGEIVMPPYSLCCLSAMNLTKFVRNPFTDEAYFDVKEFENTVATGIRFLDNVLDATDYPLEKIEVVSKKWRRIGLGFTGLGNVFSMMQTKYGSVYSQEISELIGNTLMECSYNTSSTLAQEKGAFPGFDVDEVMQAEFIKGLSVSTQDSIQNKGLRNIAMNTIAPTGTTSLSLGNNCSSGIEPAYSLKYDRKVRTGRGDETSSQTVYDYAYLLYKEMFGESAEIPDYFSTTLDVSPEDGIEIQAIFQRYVDHSISKTLNLPLGTTFEQYKNLFMLAYKKGLKGFTTFNPEGSMKGVLQHSTEEVARIAPKRPMEIYCDIHHITSKGAKLMILIGMLEDKAYEIFVVNPVEGFNAKQGVISKAKRGLYKLLDTNGATIVEDLSEGAEKEYGFFTRMLSLSLRHQGVSTPIQFTVDALTKDKDFAGFSRGVARVLKKYIDEGEDVKTSDVCPECGSSLIYVGGCKSCSNMCGWSKCD